MRGEASSHAGAPSRWGLRHCPALKVVACDDLSHSPRLQQLLRDVL